MLPRYPVAPSGPVPHCEGWAPRRYSQEKVGGVQALEGEGSSTGARSGKCPFAWGLGAGVVSRCLL